MFVGERDHSPLLLEKAQLVYPSGPSITRQLEAPTPLPELIPPTTPQFNPIICPTKATCIFLKFAIRHVFSD